MSTSEEPRRLTWVAAAVAFFILAVAGIAVAHSSDSSPSVPNLNFDVESFAAEMTVDLETAHAMLQAQQVLTDFADSARHNPWYSGFELINEPPNVRGVLAVTDTEGVSVPDGLPVAVVVPRISENEMVEFSAVHEEVLREMLPTVQAVTYPTSDTVSIWASDADLSAGDKAAIVELLVGESPDVLGSAEVIFRIGKAGWFGITGPPASVGDR